MSLEELEELLTENPHLRSYLESYVSEGNQFPLYVTQLSRDLRELHEVNVLYPIGDPYFIHIVSSPGTYWKSYSVISPEVQPEAYSALISVEEALAYLLVDNPVPKTKDEKEGLLRQLLDVAVRDDHSLKAGEFKVVRRRGVVKHVLAEPVLSRALKHVVLVEKIGLGIIDPLIKDPYIEDISCDGIGPIFIEHKVFGSCKSNIVLKTVEDVDLLIARLAERSGRPVTVRSPIADATLPDGSRINVIYGSDISRRGSNFTVRKFADTPISITQLIKWGTLSSLEAAYLWFLLEYGLNIWFIGETASGKTTLLRAACAFIKPTAKIVSIEDTPEIVVPHENWISEVTRSGQDGTEKVDLFDLLKAALRQRPNYIIVGEIRGKEAAIAFQAMQCVEDAYVATPSGVIKISSLYSQFGRDTDSELVNLPYPVMVYVTRPNGTLTLSRCIGIKRMRSSQLVRVRFSDGGELRVTPNHKFIMTDGNGEYEITASELLASWEAGRRGLRLAIRGPPMISEASNGSESFYIPANHPELWWMVGRLAGGDVITKNGGRYVWVSDVRSKGEFDRLRKAIKRVYPSVNLRVRPKRNALRVNMRNVPPQLIHWLMMNGLLVECGSVMVGSSTGLDRRFEAQFREGMLSAMEVSGGTNKLRSESKMEGAIQVAYNLSSLGLNGNSYLKIYAGYGIPDDRLSRLLTVIDNLSIRCDLRRVSTIRGMSLRFRTNKKDCEAEDVGGTCLGDLHELEYSTEEDGDQQRIPVTYWVKGSRVAVFSEGKRVYTYFNPPNAVYVTDVKPSEGSYVYDLVIEGGGYYIGGLGTSIPIEDTGHGVISTFHAGSVQKLIQRLTGDPIEIPKTFVDNLNSVVIQSAVRVPKTGKLERRVLSINEIIGLDPETQGINFIELFSWEPTHDAHEFRGEGTSYVLDNKISVLRGLSRREVKRIYAELRERARFLETLIGAGVMDYYQTFRLISIATQRGIGEALQVLREGVSA
ncbi:MAG: ATPase, T2SS/T4P/T4SS family [Aigarchaeota archaeon]|nr:ATPase, T2SS/T4P/T4SS family [Aigarchaeota archaeon]MDW8092577.1 ATPase, T2SS/T4P/T4SS family [Nitrososphaerota archaeon]